MPQQSAPSTLQQPLIPVSGLSINTTYYWRVSASNGTESSEWSTVWKFTTKSCTLITGLSEEEGILTSLQDGAVYQWIDCGNGNTPVSGVTDQSFTRTVSRCYAAIISLGDCVDTSKCSYVEVISGIDPHKQNDLISCYSNSTTSKITLSGLTGKEKISVVNILRKVMAVYSYDSEKND